MYYVYVIQSELTGKRYTGQTNSLDLRLRRHNGLLPSKNNSYTKINKGPWKIIYSEEYKTREEVLKREKYFKSHSGRNWLDIKLGR